MSSKEEADRVLDARRKQKACYPCRQRKVRCSGIPPCATCIQRGHPEICIVNDRRRRRPPGDSSPRSSKATKTHQLEVLNPDDISSSRDRATQEPQSVFQRDWREHRPSESVCPGPDQSQLAQGYLSFVGTNSTPSVVADTQLDGKIELNEIRPALGLQNTQKSYPFMTLPFESDHQSKLLDSLIPKHYQILKYSQCYQSIVYPFYPLVIDADDLERIFCFFLEKASVRESSGIPVFNDSVSQNDVAKCSLLLAVLAAGVLVSELSIAERTQLSREFARRSFHCTRLANFLLSPSPATIQALLVLGHVLQNDGQADAAWALMGTTVRLGQSLGLHSVVRTPNLPVLQKNRAILWDTILWQDCALSLSFDRPSLGISMDEIEQPIIKDYRTCFFELSNIGRSFIARSYAERTQPHITTLYLDLVDKLEMKWRTYTDSRSSSRSRQARIEEHILNLFFSFLVSFICRRFFMTKVVKNQDSALHHQFCLRGRASLSSIMRTFLELQSLTILPLRTWSMIHAGLSAALLYELSELWREPGSDTDNVQMRFINTISQTRSPSDTSAQDDDQPLLSPVHMKAVRALRKALLKRHDQIGMDTAGVQNRSNCQDSHNEVSLSSSVARKISRHDQASTGPPLPFAQPLEDRIEVQTQLSSVLQSSEEPASLSSAVLDDFGNIDWDNFMSDLENTGHDTPLDSFPWTF